MNTIATIKEAINNLRLEINSIKKERTGCVQGSPQWIELGEKIDDLQKKLKELEAELEKLKTQGLIKKATPSKALQEVLDHTSQEELTNGVTPTTSLKFHR
ncbi:MAG: hypothetical protein LBT94_02610 [Prevotellaceae bacterium]|jgi:uncharacterized coiled-coil DUF342 family protein|nr:hypothetical protein [Prevotellaceae bacterium]